MLLAGPNGQGLISTPVSMCAQIVAPMPPAGVIGIASQSGGFSSSWGNLARQSGVGISRAVSAGNAAQVGVADYVEWFATDPATRVGLAYVEDVHDTLVSRLEAVGAAMPLVVLRGGRTAEVREAVIGQILGHLASRELPAGSRPPSRGLPQGELELP